MKLAVRILFFLYASGLRFLSRLSASMALRLSRLVNPVFTSVLRGRYLKNLALLFPASKWTPSHWRKVETSYQNYRVLLRPEIARFFFNVTPEAVREQVTLLGQEHLQAALDQGRGVLIIEGHFGNWNYTPSILSALGWKVSAVVNPNPIPGANFRSLHEGAAKRLGLKLGFVGQDAYACVKEAFRRNQIVYLDIDVVQQTKRSRWFRLGDASILLDTGAAILALRHRVPVLFAKNILSDRGTCVTLAPAAGVEPTASNVPAPETLLQLWVDNFYQILLEDSGQWWGLSFVDLGDHSRLGNQIQSIPNPAKNC
jgi:lauroyl/myristoyl acyltransferase